MHNLLRNDKQKQIPKSPNGPIRSFLVTCSTYIRTHRYTNTYIYIRTLPPSSSSTHTHAHMHAHTPASKTGFKAPPHAAQCKHFSKLVTLTTTTLDNNGRCKEESERMRAQSCADNVWCERLVWWLCSTAHACNLVRENQSFQLVVVARQRVNQTVSLP